MPDFGAGIGDEDEEGFGGGDEGPSGDDAFGGWVDEGEGEGLPGAPSGPGGLLDDEPAGAADEEFAASGGDDAAPPEEGPFDGAGGATDDEWTDEARGDGEDVSGDGGDGGPFDDFDLSFSEEVAEGRTDAPNEPGDEPGEEEGDGWDLGSIGAGETGPDEPFDEEPSDDGPSDDGPSDEASDDLGDDLEEEEGPERAGDDGAPEEYGGDEEGYHGFEAVYQDVQDEENEPATGGIGGDGPDDYDASKKVIPFSPGTKKGGERVEAAREFSEVFNHVISREEVFNSSEAPDTDEDEYDGEFEMDDDDRVAVSSGPARPSRLRLGLLVAGLIIVLGGGALYASGVIDTLTRAIVSGPSTTVSDYLAIERLNGYVVENTKFGSIFAIEAVVKNKTSEPQEIKSIRGVLTGRGGTLAEMNVSPGRVLSSDDLKNLPRAAIEKHFSDPSGGTIPPRGIIPVMVVFTDIPAGVGEFGIDIVR